MNTYYVSADDLGYGATAESARDFAAVMRRFLAAREIDADVVVAPGISDPALVNLGNRAFEVFCGENFDVAATCAALNC